MFHFGPLPVWQVADCIRLSNSVAGKGCAGTHPHPGPLPKVEEREEKNTSLYPMGRLGGDLFEKGGKTGPRKNVKIFGGGRRRRLRIWPSQPHPTGGPSRGRRRLDPGCDDFPFASLLGAILFSVVEYHRETAPKVPASGAHVRNADDADADRALRRSRWAS